MGTDWAGVAGSGAVGLRTTSIGGGGGGPSSGGRGPDSFGERIAALAHRARPASPPRARRHLTAGMSFPSSPGSGSPPPAIVVAVLVIVVLVLDPGGPVRRARRRQLPGR